MNTTDRQWVKIKIGSKRLYPTYYVEYLGSKAVSETSCYYITIKLNKANALFLRLGMLSTYQFYHWKLSIMQCLTHILIMPMWFGVKVLRLQIECISFKKSPTNY